MYTHIHVSPSGHGSFLEVSEICIKNIQVMHLLLWHSSQKYALGQGLPLTMNSTVAISQWNCNHIKADSSDLSEETNRNVFNS